MANKHCYLFSIRLDVFGGPECSKDLYEPYAFTYESDLADRFMTERCMKVFQVEKKKEHPNKFTDQMRMLEIPLTDCDRNLIDVVGTIDEENYLQLAYEKITDAVYDLQDKVQWLLECNIINERGFDDLYRLLTIDDISGGLPLSAIDTYHIFYTLFKRSFIHPKAWERLAPESVSFYSDDVNDVFKTLLLNGSR